MRELPLIRSHERMDYKRCQKKWHWKWRRGLVLRKKSFGALDLGTWVHSAFEAWYVPGDRRYGKLYDHFNEAAESAIADAVNADAPSYEIEKAEELAVLGEAMCKSYAEHYENDRDVIVIGTEIPLEFTFPDSRGRLAAKHLLKPDMVYQKRSKGTFHLMENKTAATLGRTEHLVIDDQARPYGAMAERALRQAGVLGRKEVLSGITYNYLRKAFPDLRLKDAEGNSLNRDGSISKKQPAPLFLRKEVTLTAEAKRRTLERLRRETLKITAVAQEIRDRTLDPALLDKTPHHSCPKFCDYFAMCTSEEQGGDVSTFENTMYTRQNPYDYADTTEEPKGFELG